MLRSPVRQSAFPCPASSSWVFSRLSRQQAQKAICTETGHHLEIGRHKPPEFNYNQIATEPDHTQIMKLKRPGDITSLNVHTRKSKQRSRSVNALTPHAPIRNMMNSSEQVNRLPYISPISLNAEKLHAQKSPQSSARASCLGCHLKCLCCWIVNSTILTTYPRMEPQGHPFPAPSPFLCDYQNQRIIS